MCDKANRSEAKWLVV